MTDRPHAVDVLTHLEETSDVATNIAHYLPGANFGVSDRRFRFKPAGGFGGNRQAVSVQSGTPLRMGFGPGFGEPPLRDTSYLALACQSNYVNNVDKCCKLFI